MNTLNGRPRLLKQANLSLIRKAIKNRETATRSEIAKETKISFTTVRTLLTEMLNNGEIESIGYDQSSGGRKAERYRLRPNRYYGVAFCISDNHIHGLLLNIFGEILEVRQLDAANGGFDAAIDAYLDEMTRQKEIKSIGLGYPGVVQDGHFWKKNLREDRLHRVKLGDGLASKYGVPVVLENDLKAIAIGFMRCYQRRFPKETPEKANMVYLYFEKGSVSAGIIVEGRVVYGSHNYAGELGLIPMDDSRLLDECINDPMDDALYIELLTKILCWICGILNPQYIALAGPDLRVDCVSAVSDGVYSWLPQHMAAEILYSDDIWHDYYDGMAYLTAGKMFDEVQFIKE